MSRLPFKSDSKGGLFLEDLIAEGEAYDDFEVPPAPYQEKATIRNCSFVNCQTTGGTCVIQFGSTIENVLLENLDCGDAIRIDHSVTLTGLVVRGKKPTMLYFKPRDSRCSAAADFSPAGTAIDISRYQGDVEILGLPPTAVIRNPDRHVCVDATWNEQLGDWKKAGIGRLGFFPICVKKVRLTGYRYGFFGLPTRRSKYYDETISEMNTLADKFGLTFG